MKFLIIGCNGMAGHLISLYLKEQGHYVLGYARNNNRFVKTIIGDATHLNKLATVIRSDDFDIIINCVGILNQFANGDHASAVFLNSYLPHFLASITKNTGAYVIHMSTDCVFSGKRGQYTEDDFRDGESFYDRSKALGELDDEKNITLRNSIIGPDINASGIGLLNWFMQQTGEIKGFTKVIWTGQTTLQLAKTMEAAAVERPCGIYNMVPEESISKYDLLRLFNRYLKADALIIIPVSNVTVNKSLKRTRYDFSYGIPDYEKMIAELANWMRIHKEMYPHYYL